MPGDVWLLPRLCTPKNTAAGTCARRRSFVAHSPLQENHAARSGSAEAAQLLHHLEKKLMPLIISSCNMLTECLLFRKKNERTHCARTAQPPRICAREGRQPTDGARRSPGSLRRQPW